MEDDDVDGKCRTMSACFSTTSYSSKLFLFMVPLVLVSGFVCVNIGPKNSTSFLTSVSTSHLSPLPSCQSLPPAPAPALYPSQAAKEVSLPESSLTSKVEFVQVRKKIWEY